MTLAAAQVMRLTPVQNLYNPIRVYVTIMLDPLRPWLEHDHDLCSERDPDPLQDRGVHGGRLETRTHNLNN